MTAPFLDRVRSHLAVLYPDAAVDGLATKVLDAVGVDPAAVDTSPAAGERAQRWDQSTSIVIAYGDSMNEPGAVPLQTLRRTLSELLDGVVSHVHVLPYFPSSSDDGFAVIDHRKVDPVLGTWSDVVDLGRDFTLMSDLVVNHVSAQGVWFGQFVDAVEPGRSYLLTASPEAELSAVVRPRTHPLLREVHTAEGPRHVWCTFSRDQIDLDFRNPDVLCEMLRVVDRLLATGTRWLRLDAVAYVWKEPGTACVHLPRTHELVRLLRTLLDVRAPDAVLVTETNVPHHDNVAYFGDGGQGGEGGEGGEADAVYNFSFAPLVLHSLLTGSAAAMQRWVSRTPPAPMGTTFLNFIASHDGIGLRPAEGLLSSHEIDQLVERTLSAGGRVSEYSTPDGPRPYELNVALFELWGDSPDEDGVRLHLAAHTMMLALAGVPAFYLHSLFGAPNDVDGLARRGQARAINRHKFTLDELGELMDAPDGRRTGMFDELLRRITLRSRQPAFHPGSPQESLDLGPDVFGLVRGGPGAGGTVIALTNVTAEVVGVAAEMLPSVWNEGVIDLLSGRVLDVTDELLLEPHQSVWLSASTAS